jgi:hypothetical protein
MVESTVVINNTDTTVAEVANSTTLTVHDEIEKTLEINADAVVEITSNTAPTTLEVGIMGPQGRPGTSEDEIMYSKRVDFIDDSTLYRGEAVPGSNESEAVWRIRKITIAVDNDVTETWAGGNDNFDKAWADRAGLSYV